MLGPPIEDLPGLEPLPLKRQVSKDLYSNNSLSNNVVANVVNVLMIGTGEYTTGYVHGSASNSDKGAGVVGLTMCDLRARGKVGRIGLCGVSGTKFPNIRQHLKRVIEDVYTGINVSMETFPKDDEVDPLSYKAAIQQFQPGDAVTIFTPDDTHFEIALACVEHGLHVLVTKPAVKTLEEHRILMEAARRKGVLVAVEVHKRWDPMYVDAKDKIQALGPFSYMYSYMSQPKHQLHTFKQWAGKSSDISYYLNSHHVDFHEWAMKETSRPVLVTASASTGVAKRLYDMDCEDTITLMVQWENLVEGGGQGTAVYTSSWVAPKSDVHSQQRFFYMGQKGEVNIDQAHRGYNMADDSLGYRSVNPLFMKYTPSDGKFAGQSGYGYRSFEVFVDAVSAINRGEKIAADFDHHTVASLASTFRSTAILEAGRMSLDHNKPVRIVYGDIIDPCLPTSLDCAN